MAPWARRPLPGPCAPSISASEQRRYLGRLSWARRAVRQTAGRRRRELAGVVGDVQTLARRGELTPSRMSAVFLQLKRNAQFWTAAGLPSPGERFVFRGDPVVFEHVTGHGLQFHPLANFAKANRLRNACVGVNTARGTPCERRELRRLLDRLVQLGGRRGGFTAWEYLFAHAGGRPPWISGMAQATAVQALARGSRLLHRTRYLRTARQALGAFERSTPVGVRISTGRGRSHYAQYSFAPRLRVLNGFLQSVSGLRTYAAIAGGTRGQRLFARGDREARMVLPLYDTGRWSLYARPGSPATLEYHRLSRDFARNLCRRGGHRAYCAWDERFTQYLHDRRRRAAGA